MNLIFVSCFIAAIAVGSPVTLPIRDAMAVVDPELRVHGIAGLCVADAAIMPTVVSGNTNAATIMIGETVAALVREQLQLAA